MRWRQTGKRRYYRKGRQRCCATPPSHSSLILHHHTTVPQSPVLSLKLPANEDGQLSALAPPVERHRIRVNYLKLPANRTAARVEEKDIRWIQLQLQQAGTRAGYTHRSCYCNESVDCNVITCDYVSVLAIRERPTAYAAAATTPQNSSKLPAYQQLYLPHMPA